MADKKIKGNLKFDQYTILELDGETGEVLTTDGAGTATWAPAGAAFEPVVEGSTREIIIDNSGTEITTVLPPDGIGNLEENVFDETAPVIDEYIKRAVVFPSGRTLGLTNQDDVTIFFDPSSADTGITISDGGTTIENVTTLLVSGGSITGASPAAVLSIADDVQNAGSSANGIGLVNPRVGVTTPIKRLLAGPAITLTEEFNDIIINAVENEIVYGGDFLTEEASIPLSFNGGGF